jgi:hypothetical protein
MPNRFVSFDVPPGDQGLQLSTGGTPPLTNFRLVFGGPPTVKTRRITGRLGAYTTPSPDTTSTATDITFTPAATPFEVTVFFAQNPITVNEADFDIAVTNETTRTISLEVGAIWT